MPSPPKIFFPGSLHFVTTSVVKDLMFPPNALINEIIKKCIAQAQKLHPVDICHMSSMTTHAHMFIRVIDPQDAADFMERFKTESAHAINRLLGRKKGAVWCEGYDSPLIEDIETAMDKIAYIYENPAKDSMTESIDRYPGFTTWEQFSNLTPRKSSKRIHETRYLPRNSFSQLPDVPLEAKDYERFRRILIHGREKNYFEIDCNAWMKRFGITDPEEAHSINQRIINDVKARETKHQEKRLEEGRTVIGKKKLRETTVGTPYTPDRKGKKMLVHSVHRKLRKRLINWLKKLIAAGRYVLSRWRLGDMGLAYPMGLFPPTGIRLVEPWGW